MTRPERRREKKNCERDFAAFCKIMKQYFALRTCFIPALRNQICFPGPYSAPGSAPRPPLAHTSYFP